MDTTVDHVLAEGRWAFDAEVTSAFDNMLSRSIPQYDVMRETCYQVGSRFVKSGTKVVDVGCSRGEALVPFVQGFPMCEFVGLEVSEPMLEAARSRFEGNRSVTIKSHDLRQGLAGLPALSGRPVSLILAVLTVQFVPIEYRQRILRDCYKALTPGGALVIVEKVIGATAELDDLMVDTYLNMKRRNGYSEDEISRKRLSLEGVLVPQTARANEDMFRSAGFASVDCFWRWMNFSAWVCVKEA